MKLLFHKDYRYVGRDDEIHSFERKGVNGIEELRISKAKYVLQNLDLVFILRSCEDIEPTYATVSKVEDLYHDYVEFGGDLAEEEFISKLIQDDSLRSLKVEATE